MRIAGITQTLNSSTRPDPLFLRPASTPPVTPNAMAVATRTILRKSRWLGEISGVSTTAPYAPGAQNQPPTVCHPLVDLAPLRVHSDFVNFDISHLLESWEYQPGQVVVRKFVGKDGVEKIQLRV